MKKVIFILAVMTSFSFTGESVHNEDTTLTGFDIDQHLDDELNFRRTRHLQDNTLLQKKLNELVNTYNYE